MCPPPYRISPGGGDPHSFLAKHNILVLVGGPQCSGNSPLSSSGEEMERRNPVCALDLVLTSLPPSLSLPKSVTLLFVHTLCSPVAQAEPSAWNYITHFLHLLKT